MIIAIDPGAGGGLACCLRGKEFPWKAWAVPMPKTPGDVLAVIREAAEMAAREGEPCGCILELVGGFAGKGQPGSAMFKFGEGFGFIKGVVQTLELPLVLVRPQAWQKHFSLGTAASCKSKTVWKNKLKAEAERLYPHLKVTLATADALLLLSYGVCTQFSGREVLR